MNFLAHLHLAYLAQSSLLGNLVADFVKGDPYQYYQAAIADGIMMHRRVDKLTDNLVEVKQARSLFRHEYYRISAITLDVVWDHFLAQHWSTLEHSLSLSQFTDWAEQQIKPDLALTPENFQYLNHYLWQDKWLENYANLDFVAQALNGMANRRPKLALLATSIDDVKHNYAALEQIFIHFYPKMMMQARANRL